LLGLSPIYLREHRNSGTDQSGCGDETETVMTIAPRVSFEKAAQLMLSHKIGGLPVTERGKLVGVITASDLLQAFLDILRASEKDSARIDFVLREDHDPFLTSVTGGSLIN
jgi:CBS domain-containing protein